MADFHDLVRSRRMVWSFTHESIAPEFVVITDPATRAAIAAPGQEVLTASGHHNFVAQAPVQVVICVRPELYRSRYREPDKRTARAEIDDNQLWKVPFWYQDAGAALMLLLAAVDEGIGAAFVGSDADLRHEVLGIPEEYIPVGVALLGHEAPDARFFGDVAATPRRRRA